MPLFPFFPSLSIDATRSKMILGDQKFRVQNRLRSLLNMGPLPASVQFGQSIKGAPLGAIQTLGN
jgi:hypothetical protein